MNKYKSLFISVLLFLTGHPLVAQHSLYDMHFESSENSLVQMSDYEGKKLLIAVADVATALEKRSSTRYLGAIQKAYPSVSVLVIPVGDSADATSNVPFVKKSPLANTRYSTLVAAKAKEQHPLLKWLSDSRQNHHFDVSVKNNGQLFVISESGVLYAVLEKGASDAILKEVLTAKDVQPQQVITDINRKGHTPPR